MNQAKIDKVDNGYVVSVNKLKTTQLGQPPQVEQVVKVFTTIDDVIEFIKEES